MANNLQVQYIDPQELKPFTDNPRHHSERNIQDIQRSIKKFGFTNPILVRKEDNMIIAGHGRLASAQELGVEEVPVIYLDFSENDAKLYNITDNRTGETSEWDLVALTELVKTLEETDDIVIDDSGFFPHELDQLLADLNGEEDEADDLWDGMPEFTQEDAESYHKIIVHFEDQEAIETFANLIGQNLTSKTKSAWFPPKANDDVKSMTCEDEP